MRRNRLLGYALIIMATLNISSASILVRFASVPGFTAATWRLAIASLLTLAALAASKGMRGLSQTPARDLLLMLLSGVFLALHFGLWMTSLFHLYVAVSVTIVDSYPALLVVIGRVFLGERHSPVQLLGAATAMLGIAALSLHGSREGFAPEAGNPVLGSLLAFAGMVCVALYLSIGKRLRGRYSTLHYTLVVYAAAALVSALISLGLGVPLTAKRESLAYLVLLAVLPMLGGHSIVNYLLPRMSLLAATTPILGEPVGATLLAWLLLGEEIDPVTYLFMAVTLAGIGLVLLGEPGRVRGAE